MVRDNIDGVTVINSDISDMNKVTNSVVTNSDLYEMSDMNKVTRIRVTM